MEKYILLVSVIIVSFLAGLAGGRRIKISSREKRGGECCHAVIQTYHIINLSDQTLKLKTMVPSRYCHL